MKTLLMVLFASAALAGETNTPSEDQLTQQAIILARAGLYGEAETVCKQILAQKPDQPTVKQLLREIEELGQKREATEPGYAMRNKHEQIVVREVRFHQAAQADVIEFLGVGA